MMVLHPPASSTESQHQVTTTTTSSAANAPSSTTTSSSNVAAVRAMRARRRSKGTIAGFANSKENNVSSSAPDNSNTASGAENSEPSTTTTAAAAASASIGGGAMSRNATVGGANSSTLPLHRKEGSSSSSTTAATVSLSASASSNATAAAASGSSSATATGASSTAAAPPVVASKPCHSAQLALVCAQNALSMGSRTHLNLCPAGRARHDLCTKLQQRRQPRGAAKQQQPPPTGGFFGLEKMVGSETLSDYPAQEEDYLRNYQSHFAAGSANESDEELSSGDEEDLVNDMDEFFSEESIPVDDLDRYYQALQEPLFTPVGSADGGGLNNSTAGHHAHLMPNGGGGGAPKPLAFNRRKIRYFDTMSAADSLVARSYLEKELRRSKKRAGILLARHLRQVQREERRRKRFEKGEADDKSDSASVAETPEERELLEGGISRLETPMTSSVAAALMLESLSLNRVESVEGMSKCYDGIVAAGMAILDSQSAEPQDPTVVSAAAAASSNDSNVSGSGAGTTSSSGSSSESNKAGGASRSEILSALAPLLITSLEQPSGDVILLLAKLRRMCGTFRYQRRFVQRVAPLLIRPPRGAIWCLRHQNDMEAILAAAELIFDAAFDIFSKGWYERGQLLLADSKRAKTLDTAAKQLRSFSHEPTDSFHLGFSSGHSNHKWMAAKKRKDVANASSEPLAEWEVVAVVRQIKVSISNVMGTDWSRVTAQAEVPRPFRRGYHHHHAGKTSRSVLQAHSMEAASPKSMSPRSPSRTLTTYSTGPKSPPHIPVGLTSTNTTSVVEAMDSVFGPSFNSSSQTQQSLAERAMSPPPAANIPTSPPVPLRTTKDSDSKQPSVDPYSTKTSPPPKSPKSPPHREQLLSSARAPEAAPPLSPKRGKGKDTLTLGATAAASTTSSASALASTPLSPSASSVASVGTTGSGEMISYRPSASSASSISSAPGAATSYRMLTSTAAERKRTVAACRALRAQIQRFEDAFIQLHGRPPKGAAERAPLATTYAQYREWKRAIRADAACRIQALLRGSHTRSKLLRQNDGNLSRIVMKRSGRPGYVGANSIINKISIPVGITDSPSQFQGNSPLAPGAVGSATAAANAAEGFGSDAALAPRWASSIRRRTNSGDRQAGDSFSNTSPGRRTLSSPPPGSPQSSNSELSHLSLDDLQSRKRELKRQLKQYDITFARRHGRMPVKAEKEPIRHLYESYNALKGQIALAEQEGRHSSSSSPLPSSPLPMAPLPRSDSPSSGLAAESGPQEHDTPARAGGAAISNRSSNRNRLPRDAPSPAAAAANNNLATQDLQSLRAEKTQLHQMLRSYEREFYEEHRRQVSSFGDIRPVAAQYRRYKEIKRAIAALQQRSGDR